MSHRRCCPDEKEGLRQQIMYEEEQKLKRDLDELRQREALETQRLKYVAGGWGLPTQRRNCCRGGSGEPWLYSRAWQRLALYTSV